MTVTSLQLALPIPLLPQAPQDQPDGELVVIPRCRGLVLQVALQEPAHMLELPVPGGVEVEVLLDGGLHGPGLTQVAVPRSCRPWPQQRLFLR